MKTKVISGFYILIVLLFSCKGGNEKNFFINMKSTPISIKIDSDSYFIKSFGLASNASKIGNNSYWKLYDDDKSYFYLQGYIRKKNDSIMIEPIDYSLNKKNQREYKLFDFSLTHQKSWKLIFKDDSTHARGDSVAFLSKTIVKNDTLYNYSLTPFYFHVKINEYDYHDRGTFYLEVSKTYGIVSISRVDDLNHGLIYKAILYPKIKFINKVTNSLEL